MEQTKIRENISARSNRETTREAASREDQQALSAGRISNTGAPANIGKPNSLTNETTHRGSLSKSAEDNKYTLLRIGEVSRQTGLPETSIYDAIRAGTFPPPVKIAARSSAWVKEEIDQWIEERIATRNTSKGVTA